MAIMAVDITRSLRGIEVTPAVLRTDSRKHDSLLDQLRLNIFRSSTAESDYLLELDDARAVGQKAELKLLHARIEDILRTYEQKLPDSEKDAFNDMRDQVESYLVIIIGIVRMIGANASTVFSQVGSAIQ